jgi:hypothetical protein
VRRPREAPAKAWASRTEVAHRLGSVRRTDHDEYSVKAHEARMPQSTFESITSERFDLPPLRATSTGVDREDLTLHFKQGTLTNRP